MTKKIDKNKTIIKDDGVRIIFKNDIVHSVIYTKSKPPPLSPSGQLTFGDPFQESGVGAHAA